MRLWHSDAKVLFILQVAEHVPLYRICLGASALTIMGVKRLFQTENLSLLHVFFMKKQINLCYFVWTQHREKPNC